MIYCFWLIFIMIKSWMPLIFWSPLAKLSWCSQLVCIDSPIIMIVSYKRVMQGISIIMNYWVKPYLENLTSLIKSCYRFTWSLHFHSKHLIMSRECFFNLLLSNALKMILNFRLCFTVCIPFLLLIECSFFFFHPQFGMWCLVCIIAALLRF